jgi:hypothetical protein
MCEIPPSPKFQVKNGIFFGFEEVEIIVFIDGATFGDLPAFPVKFLVLEIPAGRISGKNENQDKKTMVKIVFIVFIDGGATSSRWWSDGRWCTTGGGRRKPPRRHHHRPQVAAVVAPRLAGR